MGKGSGSVTTFSRADGFVTIPRHAEIVEAGEPVEVRLIGRGLAAGRPGRDRQPLRRPRLSAVGASAPRRDRDRKLLAVGSSAGLAAAKRGECDLAGIHLLDPDRRVQPPVSFRRDWRSSRAIGGCRGSSFAAATRGSKGAASPTIVATALNDPGCVMVNRNQGSGTRILIDRLLASGVRSRHKTERLLQSAHESQRRRRRRRARPRRLGPGHRIRRPQPSTSASSLIRTNTSTSPSQRIV